MKILVIGRSYPQPETGMIGTFEFEQAKVLQKLGNEVVYFFCDTRSIFSLQKCGKFKTNDNGMNVYGRHLPIGRMPSVIYNKIKDKEMLNDLAYVISKEKPDIIHIHYPVAMCSIKIWEFIKTYNIPIVVTEHFTGVLNKTISAERVNVLKKIVKEADKFICVSEDLKRSVIELAEDNENIIVIPNIVNKYQLNDIDKEEITFIAIGRLVKSKRFDLIISAFANAFKDKKEVKLKIIGDGPVRKKLEKVIEKHEIKNQVIMTGYVERARVFQHIEKSSVLVVASELETFCVPVIEAWMCGIPVIIPKTLPIVNYVTEDNGKIFLPKDENNLAKSMTEMYEQLGKYDKYQINDYAIKNFESEVVLKKILSIYEKISKI